MKNIYIGGQKSRKQGGFKWKLYTFLILFLVITGTALKVAAPTIVEKWINQQGRGKNGYAFSIRDVKLSPGTGEIDLIDVKVFHPETRTEILEAPHLTVQVNLRDILMGEEKKISLSAEKMDLILSPDLVSEVERMKTSGEKKRDLYLNSIEGKIGQLNVIEQKEDSSRTVVALNDVNVKVKDVTPHSINKKTEFSVTSTVADGGTLNLSGKTTEEAGRTPWSIHGTLKQIPTDFFNMIAGIKLPFSFYEPTLNAEISAHSENGLVSGEIVPDIKRLDLLDERAGIPPQSIKRVLTEELTFSLPFTLKNELTLQFEDVYRKLKNYRLMK